MSTAQSLTSTAQAGSTPQPGASASAQGATRRDDRGHEAPQDATPDVRWLSEQQQRYWRSYLSGAARLTEALTRQLEADSGVSLSEYEILVRLSERDGRMRMAQLADSLAHSRSRVTHTIKRMEEAELVVREASWRYDNGLPCAEHANTAKLLAAEAAFDAADRALQTHGGMGYAKEYDVERWWREARLMKIAPISQEMVLNYLAEHVLGLPRSY